MTENQFNHYNLVLSGTIRPGSIRQSVIKASAQLLKINAEQTELLFTGKPKLVKRNISHKRAYQLQQQLIAVGAEASLQRITVAEAKTEFTLVPEGEELTPFEELAKKLRSDQSGDELVECAGCQLRQPAAAFCIQCGQPLQSIEQKSHLSQSGKWLWIAVILIVAVLGSWVLLN